MREPARVLVGVLIVASIVIGFLFLALHSERHTAAQLREHVAELGALASLAEPPALTPAVAKPPSANVASQLDDAPQTDPAPDAAPVTAPLRALFSPAIREALGLTQQEGEAFVQLLRNGGTEAEYVALIGGEKYEQYQAIQRAQAREQSVRLLRTTLADTRHPLTDAQATQLDHLLAAEQRRRAEDTKARPRPTDPHSLLDHEEATLMATRTATERMIADAQAFLSAEQVAMLEIQLGSSLSQQADNLRIRRAQLGAAGR